MVFLAERWPSAGGIRRRILDQTARELLLMQSSDWPFLMATGQAVDYAAGRFREHAARFHRLAFMAEAEEPTPADIEALEQMESRDNVFPDIDYRDWSPLNEAMAAEAADGVT